MQIVKPGILDSFQDHGRQGFAHIGVGVGGCMDQLSCNLANILVGNNPGEAVLEMHFPAPVINFPDGTTISICGADFGAVVSGSSLPVNRKIFLPANSTLNFTKRVWGQRAYLAVAGGWKLDPVMGSKSTHLQAGFGGWNGRGLIKGDLIPLKNNPVIKRETLDIQKWFAGMEQYYRQEKIQVLKGPEWHWLTDESQGLLISSEFEISAQSNRMAYQLGGPVLAVKEKMQLVSSSVLPGTIQLLPNGQLLLLMADAQTIGGYPRILQVAEIAKHQLAQMGAGEKISFEQTQNEQAVEQMDELNKQINLWQSSIHLIANLGF